MVSSIVGTMRLTKVMMDGGSGLNILYTSTLDRIGIPRSSLRPSKASFYGIVSRKEAVPLKALVCLPDLLDLRVRLPQVGLQ